MDKINTYGGSVPDLDGCLIIGQDDDNDYDESGYVAWIDKQGNANLMHYSHCSCYGTWEDFVKADWTGTLDDLVKMAVLKTDPDMLTREADPKDYDYDHLMKVYSEIIKWHNEGRPLV